MMYIFSDALDNTVKQCNFYDAFDMSGYLIGELAAKLLWGVDWGNIVFDWKWEIFGGGRKLGTFGYSVLERKKPCWRLIDKI